VRVAVKIIHPLVKFVFCRLESVFFKNIFCFKNWKAVVSIYIEFRREGKIEIVYRW